jgi:hypothetical protein
VIVDEFFTKTNVPADHPVPTSNAGVADEVEPTVALTNASKFKG